MARPKHESKPSGKWVPLTLDTEQAFIESDFGEVMADAIAVDHDMRMLVECISSQHEDTPEAALVEPAAEWYMAMRRVEIASQLEAVGIAYRILFPVDSFGAMTDRAIGAVEAMVYASLPQQSTPEDFGREAGNARFVATLQRMYAVKGQATLACELAPAWLRIHHGARMAMTYESAWRMASDVVPEARIDAGRRAVRTATLNDGLAAQSSFVDMPISGEWIQ